MNRIIGILLLLALAAPAGALEIRNVIWDRAFSPNGDGIQDISPISFVVDSGTDTLRILTALIAETSEVPPPPETWLRVLYHEDGSLGILKSIHQTWDGLDDAEEPYPDGYYHLHLRAATDTDSIWRSPAGEIEINTVAPTFLSMAVEPQPFTPLLAGADTVQQVHFTSADFDTLSDTAILDVMAYSESAEEYYSVALLGRDPDYALQTGEGVRYRFLWDGRDGSAQRTDGVYTARMVIEDDAGNRSETQLSLDMDVLAPTFSVLAEAGWAGGLTRYDLHPDALPDSLWIRATDRHGVDSCKVAWGLEAEFDTLGIVRESGVPENEDFLFLIPAHWTADSTYKIRLDARDRLGQWKSELSAPTSLTVVLDSEAPEAPVWLTQGGERIQGILEINGSLFETGLDVFLYRDEGALPVDTTEVVAGMEFSFNVQLAEGDQSFRLTARDAAGNESDYSDPLEIRYRSASGIRIPGRFRGADGEAIQVNTPSDAASVEIRFFSLEGALIRVLDAVGGPRQWSANWDRRDSNGRRPAPGLLIVTIRSHLQSGEIMEEKKVVALVD